MLTLTLVATTVPALAGLLAVALLRSDTHTSRRTQ